MRTKWTPRTTLQLPPSDHRCIGFAPSRGRKCMMPIRFDNINAMERIITQISQQACDPNVLRPQLEELARCGLCVRYHQYQAGGLVEKWTARMEEEVRARRSAGPDRERERGRVTRSSRATRNWILAESERSSRSSSMESERSRASTSSSAPSRTLSMERPDTASSVSSRTLSHERIYTPSLTASRTLWAAERDELETLRETIAALQRRLEAVEQAGPAPAPARASSPAMAPGTTRIAMVSLTSPPVIRPESATPHADALIRMIRRGDFSALSPAREVSTRINTSTERSRLSRVTVNSTINTTQSALEAPPVLSVASSLSSLSSGSTSTSTSSSPLPARSLCLTPHVRRLPLDEDCPICYEPFSSPSSSSPASSTSTNTTSIAWCKSGCGRSVHTSCLTTWHASCRRFGNPLTCTVCRTPWAVECACETNCKRRHVERREVESGETCAVCLERMSEDDDISGDSDEEEEGTEERLVWCRDGCGKSVHGGCWERWKEGCEEEGNEVTCVMCRTEWRDGCEC